jgi:MFS family permease
VKCVCGSGIETNLRCGKCDKPICRRCLVQTPVGARCSECARVHKLPIYNVSAAYYLRAVAVALVAAVITGLLWGLVSLVVAMIIPISLNLLLAPLAGYAIGEVVSRAVNRKRGTGLVVIGSLGVVLSYLASVYLVNILSPWSPGYFSLFAILAVALGIYFAVTRLR